MSTSAIVSPDAAPADAAPSPVSIEIREATLADLPSLQTIFPRAFHPQNAFMRKCMPDTPAIRDWYNTVYKRHITSSLDFHILIAYDPAAPPATQVAGILCLEYHEANHVFGEFWGRDPLTPDHDAKLWNPVIENAIQGRAKAFLPPDGHFANQPYFDIVLLGVDEAYKGRGFGGKLLKRAGEIADEKGVVAFVEANASAEGMYRKFGFVDQGSIELEGPEGSTYVEHILIRPASGR